MRLLVLDTAQPEQFYLPKPSLARYAGFEAVVEGARLPLNAERLVEANVLDALFEAQHSGDVLGHGKGPTDISSSFAGASLLETCCFLRWLYQPDRALPDEFAHPTAAGGLLGAARLAHKLDASGLLEKIGSHLLAAVPNITTAQLINCLHLADSCELEALAGACSDRLASKLLTELPWPEPVAGQLGGCCAPTLVSLMGRMAASSAAVQEGKVAAALAQQKRAADAALAEVKRAGEVALAEQKQAANAALAEQTRTAQAALAEQKRAAEVALDEKQKAEAALAEQIQTVQAIAQHLYAVKAPPLVCLDSTFSGSNTCVFELEVFCPACLPPPRSDNFQTNRLFLAGLMWDVLLAASPLPGRGCTVYVALDAWYPTAGVTQRNSNPISFAVVCEVVHGRAECSPRWQHCSNSANMECCLAEERPQRLRLRFSITKGGRLSFPQCTVCPFRFPC